MMDENLLEFISRAEKLCKPIWNEYREKRRLKIEKWNNENPIKRYEALKKYLKTDLGKYARSKVEYNRRTQYKNTYDELSWEEKKLIGRFYRNCPNGHEVDHIIPVSKGGMHRLSNLQYLTREENRRKSNKLNYIKSP